MLELLEVGIQGPPGPPGSAPTGPVFTRSAGKLTRVDYDDGSYKGFTYTGDVLVQVDYTKGGSTTRKALNYVFGELVSIDQTVL